MGKRYEQFIENKMQMALKHENIHRKNANLNRYHFLPIRLEKNPAYAVHSVTGKPVRKQAL